MKRGRHSKVPGRWYFHADPELNPDAIKFDTITGTST